MLLLLINSKTLRKEENFLIKLLKIYLKNQNMNKYLDNFYDWWKNIDKFLLFLILGLFLLGLFFH